MVRLSIRNLVFETEFYPRQQVNYEHVQRIVDAMEQDAVFPPIIICKQTKRVADGWHRAKAVERVGGLDAEIPCIEKHYTRESDFFLDSVRLNAEHGLSLSASDRLRVMSVADRLQISASRTASAMKMSVDATARLGVHPMFGSEDVKAPALSVSPRFRTNDGVESRGVFNTATPSAVFMNASLSQKLEWITSCVRNGRKELGTSECVSAVKELVTLLDDCGSLTWFKPDLTTPPIRVAPLPNPQEKLSDWSDARLWGELKVSEGKRAEEIRNALVIRNTAIVYSTAKRLHANLPKCVDDGDLIAPGTFGLINAVNAFDVHRGIKFSTFASRFVAGAMIDHLRGMDAAPRLVRSRQKLVSKATAKLRERLGHEPSHEEVSAILASELELSVDQVERLMDDGKERWTCSLTDQRGDGENPATLGALIADAKLPEPGEEMARDDWWVRVCAGLEQTDRTIVELYYRDGLTSLEIAKRLGISESRVSQRHTALLEQIKSKMTRFESDEAA